MADVNVLIERWQAGDERAAEALYNQHRDRTFRLAYGLLGDGGDAEEAAQDALTYALLNIKRYDAQRSKFTTWLHMITVSRCRDIQRKRKLATFPLMNWLQRGHDKSDSRSGPEQKAVTAETRSQVWEAVQALSPVLREVIVLRYWNGHTYQEIADIVDCPLGTAQSRARLAYQRLADSLDDADVSEMQEEWV